jgi:hypothetical protein
MEEWIGASQQAKFSAAIHELFSLAGGGLALVTVSGVIAAHAILLRQRGGDKGKKQDDKCRTQSVLCA